MTYLGDRFICRKVYTLERMIVSHKANKDVLKLIMCQTGSSHLERSKKDLCFSALMDFIFSSQNFKHAPDESLQRGDGARQTGKKSEPDTERKQNKLYAYLMGTN